jgi:hypothetical protein
VANFLFDVHYFLEQTLPDVLAFKRVVVFYGEGVDAQGIAYWKGLLEGSGNTVDFVRLIPSDPPRSRTNPLDVMLYSYLSSIYYCCYHLFSKLPVFSHRRCPSYKDVSSGI